MPDNATLVLSMPHAKTKSQRGQRVVVVIALLSAAFGCGGVSHGGTSVEGSAGGDGGPLVISGEPQECSTADGLPGILIVILPYPGAALQCEPINQAGPLDPGCPTDSIYRCDPIDCYAAKSVAGCCRPDGLCGLLDDGFFWTTHPLGCFSRQPYVDHSAFFDSPHTAVACGK